MHSTEEKLAAVSLVVEHKMSTRAAAKVAGVSHETVRRWKGQLEKILDEPYDFLGRDPRRGEAPHMDFDNLPDDPEELKKIIFDLQFEKDLTEEVLRLVKKDRGVDPRNLPNREKAILVDAMARRNPRYSISLMTGSLALAPATFYYHRKRAPMDPDEDIRQKVVEACGEHPMWGYRRIKRALDAEGGDRTSEKRVRRVMGQEGLQPPRRRKSSRYSSYSKGADTSDLPNIPLRDDGTHGFLADRPNALWVTDVTEFLLPNGDRVYLSPILDCFDGSLPAWRIGTSEKADDLTNPALEDACRTLAPGDRVVSHSDRGGQYHSAGWIEICGRYGVTRSMSRRGHSPDNARMEGFFGRLKMEFFDVRDWKGVGTEEFIAELDSWLLYYNEERPKLSLGWMSPMQYRRSWLAAA